MRYLVILVIFIFITNSCSSIKNLPNVNLNTNEGKYELIFKNAFYKSYKNFKKNKKTITVNSKISFNVINTLSIKGKSNLKRLKGFLNYQIIDVLDNKVINSGTISSSINYGSITSLYGIETSLNFAKERLSKLLAKKLSNRIILRMKLIDNQSSQ